MKTSSHSCHTNSRPARVKRRAPPSSDSTTKIDHCTDTQRTGGGGTEYCYCRASRVSAVARKVSPLCCNCPPVRPARNLRWSRRTDLILRYYSACLTFLSPTRIGQFSAAIRSCDDYCACARGRSQSTAAQSQYDGGGRGDSTDQTPPALVQTAGQFAGVCFFDWVAAVHCRISDLQQESLGLSQVASGESRQLAIRMRTSRSDL